MFETGHLVIYSVHGICQIDGIIEKEVLGTTRRYYELHPVSNVKLKISTPVDNDSLLMVDLIDREEAEKVMLSFKSPGTGWIEKNTERAQTYSKLIRSGDREEIANIINALMRQKQKAESNNKKLNQQDQVMLASAQNVLFQEMAIALDTSYESILGKVNGMLA
ncbi:CarD family transcriptional regulator [Paenibacillus lactis]|uniref:CarD family transcriptional regulator n=1 Tax=Paenibacillus lactis TaxID=228574 RepID=UPI0011A0D63A